VELGGFGGGIDVRVAVPDDAPAIRSVQARTWLATYPNPELGITREGLRRYLEGEDGERIAERIARIRQRLSAQAGGLLLTRTLAWHGDDQDVYLMVAAYNERAMRFYARFGFVVTGPAAGDALAIDGVVVPELEMVRRGVARSWSV
jgi:hypothetical protein